MRPGCGGLPVSVPGKTLCASISEGDIVYADIARAQLGCLFPEDFRRRRPDEYAYGYRHIMTN